MRFVVNAAQRKLQCEDIGTVTSLVQTQCGRIDHNSDDEKVLNWSGYRAALVA
jgi:hypothetical protein